MSNVSAAQTLFMLGGACFILGGITGDLVHSPFIAISAFLVGALNCAFGFDIARRII